MDAAILKNEVRDFLLRDKEQFSQATFSSTRKLIEVLQNNEKDTVINNKKIML
jgi:hypothetical protein